MSIYIINEINLDNYPKIEFWNLKELEQVHMDELNESDTDICGIVQPNGVWLNDSDPNGLYELFLNWLDVKLANNEYFEYLLEGTSNEYIYTKEELDLDI